MLFTLDLAWSIVVLGVTVTGLASAVPRAALATFAWVSSRITGVIQLYFVQCLLRPLLVGCAFPRIGCSCCPFDVLSAWHSALCSSVEIKLQKRVTCYVFGQMLLLLRLPQGNLVLFYAEPCRARAMLQIQDGCWCRVRISFISNPRRASVNHWYCKVRFSVSPFCKIQSYLVLTCT
jgi:hypothetical protein